MDTLQCLTCGGIAVSRADDPTWDDCPRCGVVEIDSGTVNGAPFEAYSVANHLAWKAARRERAAGRGVKRPGGDDLENGVPF